ncbi:hypothetical protein WN943_011386 [Citrus x changshan-huyou]
MVNLAARFVSQDTLENFSHLSATHALEALARNQVEVAILDHGRAYRDVCKVIKRPCENRRTRACFDESQPHERKDSKRARSAQA